MAWTHYERLMSCPLCEHSMACTHYKRSMECPHEYLISFPHPPNQTVLSMTTYLRPYSSDLLPVLSFHPGVGRRGWHCYHHPLAYLRLHCYLRPISHQCDRLFSHHILHRSCGSVPLSSAWYRSLCSFPSVLHRIPDLHHH